MKTLTCSLLFFLCLNAFGQGMDTIPVTVNNYTYLVFDSNILATESGTDDFEHDGNKNIVSLQATSVNAKPTTLMVQTQTKIYVWILEYRPKPKQFLYNFKPTAIVDTKPDLIASRQKEKTVGENSERKYSAPTGYTSQVNTITAQVSSPEKFKEVPTPDLIRNRMTSGNRDSDIKSERIQSKFNWVFKEDKISFRDMADIEAGIYFTVYDIYLDKDFIYFKMNVANTSSIAYDIDFVSFEIKHGKGFRSRESVSALILPAANHESVKTVFPDTNETIIYSLKLYAFEESDKLKVKITELGGRRSLEFIIPSKTFTNAKTLPL